MKAILSFALASLTATASAQAQPASPPHQATPTQAKMPTMTTRSGKHVNRIIDMWLKDQPVYYTELPGGGYAEGKALAGTKADYISYDMEHGSLDFTALREFMRGLADGGTTRTGHRTPAVIATLPIQGTADAVRANAWMIQQALATGIHGILLCNAESAEAARAMIEAARYPFAPIVSGLNQGYRGNGSQYYASKIWGITPDDYLRLADPWPLNPDGELLFGVKIENPRADANVESTVRVPGVAYAEWGPGDHSFYLLGATRGGGNPIASLNEFKRISNTPAMVQVRARVLAATKEAGAKFLNFCDEDTVIDQLKDGVMICTAVNDATVEKGRAYTKRTDPG